MPKKQDKPEAGWNRVLGVKLTPEQDAKVDEAMPLYRKRTGMHISRAIVVRDFGAKPFVIGEGLDWPEKRAERP